MKNEPIQILHTTLHLIAFAQQKKGDQRDHLMGVNVQDGEACATNGRLLGIMPEPGGYTGFLPSEACAHVLKGAKEGAKFSLEGAFLCRDDGASFKITEDSGRAEFPDYEKVINRENTFKVDESVAIDLGLLACFDTYFRKTKSAFSCGRASKKEGIVEFHFNGNLEPINITNKDFFGVIMPVMK